MKKKFLALALTAVMALSLAACGGDTQSTDTDADTSGDESASGSQTYISSRSSTRPWTPPPRASRTP